MNTAYMDRLFQTLMLSCIYSGLETQKILVDPQVTGYLGHNITLPCSFQDSSDYNLTQGEWRLGPTTKNSTSLGVGEPQKVTIHQTALTGRVKFPNHLRKEFSMTISNVKKSDEGRYICLLAVFPSGSFEGISHLTVQDQPEPMPLSSGAIMGIAIVAFLVTVVMAASVYLFINKKMKRQTVSHSIVTDTSGPHGAQTHAIGREEDLVYSEITVFQSPQTTRGRSSISTHRKHPDTSNPDDTTIYSKVAMGTQRPVRPDDVATYSQVKKKQTCEVFPLA